MAHLPSTSNPNDANSTKLSRFVRSLGAGLRRFTPGWDSLAALSGRKAVSVSFATLITVPALANLLHGLSQAGTSAAAWSVPGWLHPFVAMLGLSASQLEVPINFARAFFASVCALVAQLVFRAACPRIVRETDSFKRWLRSDGDGIRALAKGLKELGESREHEATSLARSTFLEQRDRQNRSKLFVRLVVVVLFAFSVGLVLIVLASQMRSVLGRRSIVQLLGLA